MILAEATPNANTVWIVLIALASFGGNVATIALVFMGNKKQKREVSFEFIPASKEEFDKQREHCTTRHAQLFKGIETGDEAVTKVVETKLSNVESELKQQGKDIATLKKETEIQNQSLAGVTSDIKRILERLPRVAHR